MADAFTIDAYRNVLQRLNRWRNRGRQPPAVPRPAEVELVEAVAPVVEAVAPIIGLGEDMIQIGDPEQVQEYAEDLQQLINVLIPQQPVQVQPNIEGINEAVQEIIDNLGFPVAEELTNLIQDVATGRRPTDELVRYVFMGITLIIEQIRERIPIISRQSVQNLMLNLLDIVFDRIPAIGTGAYRRRGWIIPLLQLGIVGYGVKEGVKALLQEDAVKLVKEQHIPNRSNYNGGGTEVAKRVGITKGISEKTKIGTYPFHIPVDLSDFFAFLHDMEYMSNNQLDRSWADGRYFYSAFFAKDYLEGLVKYDIVDKKDIDKIVSNYADKFSGLGLGAGAVGRLLWHGFDANKFTTLKGLTTFLTRFAFAYGINSIGMPRVQRGTVRAGLGRLPFIPRTIRQAMRLPELLSQGFQRADLRNVPIPSLSTIIFGTAPWERLLFGVESGIRNKLYSDKSSKANAQRDKMMDAWYRYLGTVGKFDEKGIFQPINKNIDNEKILSDYNDFLDEYNLYVKMNDYPEEAVDPINKEDTAKYDAVVEPYKQSNREDLQPSGMSPEVILGWFELGQPVIDAYMWAFGTKDLPTPEQVNESWSDINQTIRNESNIPIPPEPTISLSPEP
jgi:hypothetical protein